MGGGTVSPGRGRRPRIRARDIRSLLWMDQPIAMVVVALFCLTSTLRGAVYLGDARNVWPILVAMVLTVAAAFAIVVVPGDPLPLPTAAALTALGPVTCLLVLPQIAPHGWIPGEIWHMRAVTVVLCFLSVRGRMWHACLGASASIAAFTLWCAATDQGWTGGLRLSTIIFAPVAISVLVAITVRPMAVMVFTLRERESDRVADEAMTRAVTEEREKQLAALDASARPLLESAAAGAEFSDADRENCAVLKERLRDTLRAPVFAEDESLCRATTAARRRGTQVLLLDDGGLTDAELVARVRVALIDELDATAGGTLTARALPAGRVTAATIVVEESDRVRRVEFGTDGRTRVEVRNGGELDRDYEAVQSIVDA